MKRTLSAKIVAKAQSAMISAVEIYNRPSFLYREETFAILALNAWELMLKGKILSDNGNRPRHIWAYAPKKLKNGNWSAKLYPRLNRTKNNMTISVFGCLQKLGSLDAEIVSNIEALVEIRDNSTHYFSASRELAEKTASICVATVKNFVLLARAWFKLDFSKSFSLCLPLAFIGYNDGISTVATGGERKLLKYLSDLTATQKPEGDYAIALNLGVKFEKSVSPEAIKFNYSKDADSLKVTVSEEDVLKNFPWSYEDLSSQLKLKIANFSQGPRYHTLRKTLETNEKLAKVRFLDPSNPKGLKKLFYSPNMAVEIEKIWALPPPLSIVAPSKSI